MIKNCRSCMSINLIKELNLGNFYLSYFLSPQSKIKMRKGLLELVRCRSCGLVQLSDVVPQKYLYTDNYGYRSGINKTMNSELKDIARKIEKMIVIKKGDILVDIGSNDGTLLKNYSARDVIKVGFDPIHKFSSYYDKPNEIFINNFFNNRDFVKKIKNRKARVITAISMFYDLEDPNEFVSDVKRCLDDDGLLVIQQNYLLSMLESNAFDNIVHEHLEYYSLSSLEALLRLYDLEVFDVTSNGLNGGSFRAYICHKEANLKKTKNVYVFREKESSKKLNTSLPYREFGKRIKKLRNQTVSFIKTELKKGKVFYVYGASTRGNTTLQYYGLGKEYFKFAVERNSDKWGSMIGSMRIPIISEKQARLDMPDYMFVLPWYFREEIIKREKIYLESGGKLIFPLPKFEIVSA